MQTFEAHVVALSSVTEENLDPVDHELVNKSEDRTRQVRSKGPLSFVTPGLALVSLQLGLHPPTISDVNAILFPHLHQYGSSNLRRRPLTGFRLALQRGIKPTRSVE